MHVVTPGNASSRAAAIGLPHRLHNFVGCLGCLLATVTSRLTVFDRRRGRGHDVFTADDIRASGCGITLTGRAGAFDSGLIRSPNVRRPQAGEEFSTHGPATTWAGAQQASGEN
jgi:hypothetical protein